MIDVEKFYKVAGRLVGNLNKDLVHHVFEKVHDRLPSENPDGYFHRTMMHELRGDSKFRKQYDRVQAITVEEEEDPLKHIDESRVQSILDELTVEGFKLEVKVFLEMAQETTARQLNIATGVRYENLLNIRNFVRNEVIRRYGSIH